MNIEDVSSLIRRTDMPVRCDGLAYLNKYSTN